MKFFSPFNTQVYLVAALLIGVLTACPEPSKPQINKISVTSNIKTVNAAGTVELSVVVEGTGGFSPDVIWSIPTGKGALSATSGSSITFTAPSLATASISTIRATSVQDSSKFGEVTINNNATVVKPTIINVEVKATLSTLAAATATTVSSVVKGAGAFSDAIAWSLESGQGTLSATSGSSITFTAPSLATANTTVIRATSVQDNTKFGTVTINNKALATITNVTVSALQTTLDAGAETTLNADVAGSNEFNNAVTWSIESGQGILSTTTGSSVTITAPSRALANTIVVRATSVQDTTKFAAVTLNVKPHDLVARSGRISSSYLATCALKTSGEAYCWGYNGSGLLGTGNSIDSSVPVLVSGGLRFSMIDVSDSTVCGVTTLGLAYCWGIRSLGVSNLSYSLVPVLVSNDLIFSSISVGAYQVCGITTSGAVYCWGGWYLNNHNTKAPFLISKDYTFLSVSAAESFSNTACAITTLDVAYCWGTNEYGEFGNGEINTNTPYVPVPVGGNYTFASIEAADGFTCGITTLGKTYCWGRVNQKNTQVTLTPLTFASNYTFKSIDYKAGRMCAIDIASDGYCWGYGNLGDGKYIEPRQPIFLEYTEFPSKISGNHKFTALNSRCGITTSNSTYCWDSNMYGSIGNGFTASTPSYVPHKIQSSLQFSSLGTGYFRTCGLDASGSAYCWGQNGSAGLGDNAKTKGSALPVLVSGNHNFSRIDVGGEHTCGITTTGFAYCWGFNDDGDIGDNTTIDRLVPTLVHGGHTFTSISANYYTCGITTTGAAYCWGPSDYGALGDGLPISENSGRVVTVPSLVTGGLTFLKISVGSYHTCGIATTGLVYCWGSNALGALGNGTITNTSTPILIGSNETFSSIAAGRRATCGLTTSGKAYCWGWNWLGTLGSPTQTEYVLVPTPVSGDYTFSSISLKGRTACGITTTGISYCWGEGERGQLGNGNPRSSSTPKKVSGDQNFTQISNNGDHTCGTSTTGATYCWGNGESDQLGVVREYLVPTLSIFTP